MSYPINVITGQPFRRHHQRVKATIGRGMYAATDPEVVGDCFRACIASIIGADTIDEVPHFVALQNLHEYFAGIELPWHDYELAREWLRAERGTDLAAITRDQLDKLDARYIVTVRSRTGPWNHAVIAHRGAVIFDPSGHGDYTIADTLDDLGLALCAPYEPDPAQQIRLWRTASDQ